MCGNWTVPLFGLFFPFFVDWRFLAMLTDTKRTEEEFNELIATEWGSVCGRAIYGDDPVVREPYQQSFLVNHSKFRWSTNASRWSMTCALGKDKQGIAKI